ncbi:peptide chain release factor N(5)-glutamine methyltransferase [Thermospira aquatica]|uniref:peptide chain release factor N(5)-glutamine methyltransferase n=1 Tax=Thermospira aquatica TaxID=2828656 RepID=A0AAX3BBX6_9SPIR|nr:peptide chain release factor N(5)-glutamine methyltransferase [Thermospira aquatica]URA09679.1 peptide chain release factor N(5)-glutamine methyltransferase [Thermospira aquatica]
MVAREAYRQAFSYLQKEEVRDPDFSARYLLAYILGIETKEIFFHWDTRLSFFQKFRFFSLVRKRARHVPLAYLVRYADFYGRRFMVLPGVLVPRPDTEHILYAVEEMQRTFSAILDVGTGTGVLAISLAFLFPQARVDACDVSVRAVSLARKNARQLGVSHIRVFHCDFLRRPPKGRYDLIVSNPPYISMEEAHLVDRAVREYEPTRALFAPEGGLGFYKALAHYACEHLTPDGCVVVEVDHKWEDVGKIFTSLGLHWQLKYDYQNMPRVIIASREKPA